MLLQFLLQIVVCTTLYIVPCASLVARHGMSSSQYQTEFNKWVNKGNKLLQVSGYSDRYGNDRYAAIWDRVSSRNPWVAKHRLTSSGYQSEFNKWVKKGYRVTLCSGYEYRGYHRFAAIWEKIPNPRAWVARHGMRSWTYQSEFTKYAGKGYRPTYISAYSVKGVDYYNAIWEKTDGRPWVARHGLSSSRYQKEFNKWVGKGFKLTIVSGYQYHGRSRYAAVWEKPPSSPAFFARHGMSSTNYQAAFDNAYYRGYKIKHISGYRVGSSIQYAAIWHDRGIWSNTELNRIHNTITAWLRRDKVPGCALAITRYDRLVYAQGFGKAHKGRGYDASPKNLFRIASISKTITSVAIFKLIEDKRLGLSDKVFGSTGILGPWFPNKAGWYERLITVQHLLEHTAGGKNWDNRGGTWGDPVSDPAHLFDSNRKLIEWVLTSRNPAKRPGTEFAYSNFGFTVLGRIIEKVTGNSYGYWVRKNIFKPIGAKDFHIGSSAGNRHREVAYYPNPWEPIPRLDSAGGWITSPIDLVKYGSSVNKYSYRKDILYARTINQMTTPSALNPGYAKGMAVNKYGWWWHGGSLTGASSVLVSRPGGFTYTILVNKYAPTNWDALHKVINGIKKWPSYKTDFF